jgi:hypothetical protein
VNPTPVSVTVACSGFNTLKLSLLVPPADILTGLKLIVTCGGFGGRTINVAEAVTGVESDFTVI